MELVSIDQRGSCQCGLVQFRARGKILFSTLCHCKTCSQSRGMSPVHVIGVTPAEGIDVTKGEDLLTLYRKGRMYYCFCEKCGCGVFQGPDGFPFRGIYPTNFHIEQGVDCSLPEQFLPTHHGNYENRQIDWHDPLPKYKTFSRMPGLAQIPGAGIQLTNTGEEILGMLDDRNMIATNKIINAQF